MGTTQAKKGQGGSERHGSDPNLGGVGEYGIDETGRDLSGRALQWESLCSGVMDAGTVGLVAKAAQGSLDRLG